MSGAAFPQSQQPSAACPIDKCPPGAVKRENLMKIDIIHAKHMNIYVIAAIIGLPWMRALRLDAMIHAIGPSFVRFHDIGITNTRHGAYSRWGLLVFGLAHGSLGREVKSINGF
jgi:hypothetical protein